MYKKTLINLSSVTLACSIFLGSGLTSFAADPSSDYPEKSEAWVNDGSEVTVNEDVTTDSSSLSAAYAGNGSQVTVNGNVENVNENWRSVGAFNGGVVEINGDVTSPNLGGCTSEGSTVGITGDVTSGGRGFITQGDNALTVVEGNVTANDTALINKNGSGTAVTGDVTGSTGINTESGTYITVGGDLNYTDNGIVVTDVTPSTIYNGTNDDNGSIVVYGSINNNSGSSDNAVIAIKMDGESADEIISKIPDILVYELPEDTEIVSVSIDDNEIKEAVGAYVTNNINYIIKEDAASSSYYTISGYNTNDDNSLKTMTINSAITVAAQEGYTISAGDNVEVVDNGDNTYTITLINSKGAITISAKLINGTSVITTAPAKASAPAQTSSDNGSSSSETEEVEAPFIFATFTVTGKTDASAEVLGANRDSADETFGLVSKPVIKVAAGSLTAKEYRNAFIKAVKEAPQGGIVRLETAAVSCIDKTMMAALAERSDVTLEVVFPYAGNTLDVTVPAGTDVMSLLDENGYCGFLYLNAKF